MGIESTVGDLVALLYLLTFGNSYAEAERNEISLFLACFLVVNDGVTCALDFLKADCTVDFSHNGKALGLSCLKQLLNTRKTLGDILAARDAARMERTHGKLCTGLADRLSGDDTYSLADCNGLTVSKVSSVALAAGAVLSAALKH